MIAEFLMSSDAWERVLMGVVLVLTLAVKEWRDQRRAKRAAADRAAMQKELTINTAETRSTKSAVVDVAAKANVAAEKADAAATKADTAATAATTTSGEIHDLVNASHQKIVDELAGTRQHIAQLMAEKQMGSMAEAVHEAADKVSRAADKITGE